MIIFGLTYPGYADTPLIEIDGSNLGNSGASCFFLISGASGISILGLAINRFTGAEAGAARMFDSDSNEVSRCRLGTYPGGTIGRGNGYGVFLEEGSSHNRISANLISGNDADGIHIKSNSNGNSINLNYIGTDAEGAADLGNGGQGVEIRWGFSENRVGLVSAEGPEFNLISGNGSQGVLVYEADSNHVQCDLIGTDLSGGGGGMANGASGVRVANGAHGNLIGDAPASSYLNIISGNIIDGISVFNDCDCTMIRGNFIGVDVTGTLDLGNGRNGIDIREGCDGTGIGEEGGADFIGGNGGDGVFVLASGNTAFMGNSIGTGTEGAALSNAGNGVTLQQAENGSMILNNVVYNAVEGSRCRTAPGGSSISTASAITASAAYPSPLRPATWSSATRSRTTGASALPSGTMTPCATSSPRTPSAATGAWP